MLSIEIQRNLEIALNLALKAMHTIHVAIQKPYHFMGCMGPMSTRFVKFPLGALNAYSNVSPKMSCFMGCIECLLQRSTQNAMLSLGA